MARISEAELAVIQTLHLSYGEPVKKLAHQAGVSVGVFRRISERLFAEGILLPFTIIDQYRLGLAEYYLLGALTPPALKKRDALLAFLQKNQAVSWYMLVGGDYDIGISIHAGSPSDIVRFSRELSSKMGRVFARKIVSQSTGFTVFQRRYISKRSFERISVSCGHHKESAIPDKVDMKLLDYMSRYPRESSRELSRRIGISHTTMDYRVKQLKKLGIIKGTLCRIHPKQIGFEVYRLLVSTTGLGLALQDPLTAFCHARPAIISLDSMIGGWDFELRCEVKNASEISSIKTQLFDAFEHDIASIQILPVLYENMTERISF